MSLSSISSLISSASSSSDAQLSTEQAAAKTLAKLIKDVASGNVGSAKADLATLDKQLGSSGAGDTNSPLGQLLTALGSDLSSGNVTGAQSAVQTFLTTLQGHVTAGTSGHHHHHHGGEAQDDSSTTQDASTFTPATSTTGTDTTSTYLATLLQAVQADQGTGSSANAPAGAIAG